jgi:hypothetical protein
VAVALKRVAVEAIAVVVEAATVVAAVVVTAEAAEGTAGTKSRFQVPGVRDPVKAGSGCRVSGVRDPAPQFHAEWHLSSRAKIPHIVRFTT